MNFAALLNELAQELEQHPALEVQEAYVRTGLDEEAISALEKRFRLRLPKGVRTFYREVNGAVIKWHLGTGSELSPFRGSLEYRKSVWGTIDILPLEDLLMPPAMELQNSPWDELMDEAAREELARFHPLDQNVEEAMVGLLVIGSRMGFRLQFLRQEAEWLLDTRAAMQQYVRALRQCRGFAWWQEVFALRPAGLKSSAMFHYVSQLFPAERFSAFLH